jgi:Na+/H+ antiporter NhaD/arsenite permease-like protein
LIITTDVRESEYFYSFLKKILKKLENERKLAITLILFSTLVSTVLTNYISLFILIPLIISMQDLIKNDLSKLVIFEEISVNVGSTLTPIGNSQNLYL